MREAVELFFRARAQREPFLLLTGNPGTGKTTAIQAIRKELPSGTPVALVRHSTLSARELLDEIVAQMRLPRSPGASTPELVRQIERHLASFPEGNLPAVLFLDEAHLLASPVLEEVRLLSSLLHELRGLLQTVLVGPPELVKRLREARWRSLEQRIGVRHVMRPLSEEEAREYLFVRLREAGSRSPDEILPARTVRVLHRQTRGIPREIEIVANLALTGAFLESAPAVGPDHVRGARREYRLGGIWRSWSRSFWPIHSRASEDTVPFPLPLEDRPREVKQRIAAVTISCAVVLGGTAMTLFTQEEAIPEATVESRAAFVPAVEESHEVSVPPVEKKEPEQAPPRRKRGLAERYPSTVEVESDVPAVVWLGDERMGAAPGRFNGVPPGLYRLKLEAGKGRVFEKDIIVTPGSTTHVRARLAAR